MAGVQEQGGALAAAVEQAVPGWVERSVERVLVAWAGQADGAVMARASEAGRAARDRVMAQLEPLLAADVDQQSTNPLTILRDAVRFPTEVLRDAGVPPVVRDEFAERHFPDDDYDLTPAAFADVDPALHEPGLVWGAAKAHAHLTRRKGAT